MVCLKLMLLIWLFVCYFDVLLICFGGLLFRWFAFSVGCFTALLLGVCAYMAVCFELSLAYISDVYSWF